VGARHASLIDLEGRAEPQPQHLIIAQPKTIISMLEVHNKGEETHEKRNETGLDLSSVLVNFVGQMSLMYGL
jgi:hypothetical protein